MADKKRRTCQICGRPYVPTSNVQKYCPDCRDEMKRNGGSISDAYKAYKKAGAPGPVRVTQIETPEAHLMDFTETPEDPAIMDGYHALADAITQEVTEPDPLSTEALAKRLNAEPILVEVANNDLPDGLAIIEEHAEILRRYYRGELIDKDEFLARIRERLEDF